MDNYNSVLTQCITYAKKNNYKSYDVSDLLKTKYLLLVNKLPNSYLKKAARLPYNFLMRNWPGFIRFFVWNKGYIYPQGQAMMIRAYISLAKKNHPLGDVVEAEKIANWIIENRSKHSAHYGWGQPFLWYSRKPFPVNIPRATVSSQVAWAMLELYEHTENKMYLDIAIDTCKLFQKEFNYSPDTNGNICISYTTIDNYHIHNASMLAASVVFRTAKYTSSEELLDFGKKIADFTASHQNEDGSFYYWAPPDKLNYMIDNYHTGFVLESYRTIIDDCDDNRYDEVYNKGMKYYYDNLFEGVLPKISNKSTYPINIQSCAQSIMSFYLDGKEKKYSAFANEIADYTIENLYLENKSHFLYKLYKDGKADKSYYFRWGDAWMIRALAYLV